MDNHDIKEYRRQISNMVKEKQDMLVVIDTLQQILGRAESIVKELDKDKYDYVFSPAAKWSMNWKPEK
jgi:diacylglycerol kinase family enzyme